MNSDLENDDYESEHENPQRKNEENIERQLDEFRLKWKKEIQQRTVYGALLDETENNDENRTQIDEEEQAKDFFQRASDLEREGKLYDAIKFYRAAMQLVPDIEFRMARRNLQPATTNNIFNERENQESNDLNQNIDSNENDPEILDKLQNMNLEENENLWICQKNFPQQATHISVLPSEVLIYIFRWVVSSELDVRSLEQCSRVCRGFYRCSRDPQLWKMICSRIWSSQNDPMTTHMNWRHMFIERPHIIFNGVYISRASYIRQGEQSLDNFYSPWHLVEYYRYIRFFPDGIVMMHTSAEEPRKGVVQLKNRFAVRDPSLIYGNYRLQNSRVVIAAQRTSTVNSTHRRLARENPTTEIEQIIHMEFEISDAGRKKHHQLVWRHYEIKFLNKRTGEERPTTLEVNDRHAYPPLIFSRVKSYNAASEQVLK